MENNSIGKYRSIINYWKRNKYGGTIPIRNYEIYFLYLLKIPIEKQIEATMEKFIKHKSTKIRQKKLKGTST